MKIWQENTGTLKSIKFSDNPTEAGFTDITSVANYFLYGTQYGLTISETLTEIVALITDWATHDAGEKAQVLSLIQENRFVAAITEDIKNDVTAPYLGFKIFNITSDKVEWWNGTLWQPLETQTAEWRPNSVPLGGVLVLGAIFYINSGAGVYLSFSGSADDKLFFNDSLNKAGLNYDGSDLAIKLHCRISSNGDVGDTVGLIVDYAILKDGDNTSTTFTNIPQVNYDVSTEIQDEMFDIVLGTMTGVVGADTLMITLTRNAQGGGADSFAGNLEIIGIEIVKL